MIKGTKKGIKAGQMMDTYKLANKEGGWRELVEENGREDRIDEQKAQSKNEGEKQRK